MTRKLGSWLRIIICLYCKSRVILLFLVTGCFFYWPPPPKKKKNASTGPFNLRSMRITFRSSDFFSIIRAGGSLGLLNIFCKQLSRPLAMKVIWEDILELALEWTTTDTSGQHRQERTQLTLKLNYACLGQLTQFLMFFKVREAITREKCSFFLHCSNVGGGVIPMLKIML